MVLRCISGTARRFFVLGKRELLCPRLRRGGRPRIIAANQGFCMGRFIRNPFMVPAGMAALAAGLLIAGVLITPASAQQRIGEAAAVQNQVVRVSGGTTAGLSTGGSVFRNETIRTAAASSARLVFLDQTNLSVGPSSSVVLNQFVYTGGSAAQAVGVNLVRGAFRFTTGASDKNAYRINTPVATIGVRGTVLDISSQGRQTMVTMVDNSQALVCSIAARQCLQLNGVGDSVVVTAAGVVRVPAGSPRFSFASNCTGNICGNTLIADAGNIDLLCGR